MHEKAPADLHDRPMWLCSRAAVVPLREEAWPAQPAIPSEVPRSHCPTSNIRRRLREYRQTVEDRSAARLVGDAYAAKTEMPPRPPGAPPPTAPAALRRRRLADPLMLPTFRRNLGASSSSSSMPRDTHEPLPGEGSVATASVPGGGSLKAEVVRTGAADAPLAAESGVAADRSGPEQVMLAPPVVPWSQPPPLQSPLSASARITRQRKAKRGFDFQNTSRGADLRPATLEPLDHSDRSALSTAGRVDSSPPILAPLTSPRPLASRRRHGSAVPLADASVSQRESKVLVAAQEVSTSDPLSSPTPSRMAVKSPLSAPPSPIQPAELPPMSSEPSTSVGALTPARSTLPTPGGKDAEDVVSFDEEVHEAFDDGHEECMAVASSMLAAAVAASQIKRDLPSVRMEAPVRRYVASILLRAAARGEATAAARQYARALLTKAGSRRVSELHGTADSDDWRGGPAASATASPEDSRGAAAVSATAEPEELREGAAVSVKADPDKPRGGVAVSASTDLATRAGPMPVPEMDVGPYLRDLLVRVARRSVERAAVAERQLAGSD